MYLDTLSRQAQVGYGDLGLNGNLGYESKRVTVQQREYAHALSAHARSRLVFQLDGHYRQFQCQVALNDDVGRGMAHAHFIVRADGQQVACEPYVVAGEAPRRLRANISGAHTLELSTETTQWELCHSVWLDPQVDDTLAPAPARTLADPLGRAEILLPRSVPRAEYCIATVVSPGFESFLDDMLGSLFINGHCRDARLVIFAVDANETCQRLAEKYHALIVHCTKRAPLGVTIKSVLYAVARVIDARFYLCLDADLMILGELSPLFAAAETAPGGSVFACREGNYQGKNSLASAIQYVYRGSSNDLARILGRTGSEGQYPLVVNDGVFAGSKSALLALDGVIRSMPNATAWVDERHRVCWWRNQFIFNLALARLNCGIALDDPYNVQLHVQDVQIRWSNGQPQADWHGRRVRGLHFCGVGRPKYPEWKGLFAAAASRELAQ